MGIEMRGDKTLPYKRQELIDTLKSNLKSHKEIVKEARENFKQKVLEAIDAKLREIDGLSVEEIIDDFRNLTEIRLSPPTDYSEEYEDTIALFERADGDFVDLTAHEFKMFFLDEWTWAHEFFTSNAPYSISARERRVRIHKRRR